MPCLAITGKIGSGKSFLTKYLSCFLPSVIYSADEHNRELLSHDLSIRQKIVAEFGMSIIDSNHQINRSKILEKISNNMKTRIMLENILHPILQSKWKPLAEKYRNQSDYFIAEIPLLYEKNLSHLFQKVIFIESIEELRMDRIQKSRYLSDEQIDQWKKLTQTPPCMMEPNYILLNNSSLSVFKNQIIYLIQLLKAQYDASS